MSKNDRPTQTAGLPDKTWTWVTTIKIARRGDFFAAWEDVPSGLLVHGRSMEEVLGRLRGSWEEMEIARRGVTNAE